MKVDVRRGWQAGLPIHYDPTVSSLRRRLPAFALVGALFAAGGLFLWGIEQADPLREAWSAVQRHDAYTFRGTTAARIGNSDTTHSLRGEGHADGRLRVEVVDRDGAPESVASSETASPSELVTGSMTTSATETTTGSEGITPTVSSIYDLDWPNVTETDANREATREADEYALATILPTGDPLQFLAVAHAPRLGEVEAIGERSCQRVEFLVSGLTYGAWWQRHQGYVPAGAASGPIEKLSGEGVVWIDEDRDERAHLPCRISVRLALVRLAGEQAGVGEADWEYGDWR